MTRIRDDLGEIQARVANALTAASRDGEKVIVLAVSKQQSADAIEAARQAGQRHFGENYVQDALAKMDRLTGLDIEWHFIGRIQSNKTRPIAERFGWVHTVDRARIALRLNEHRPASLPPLRVFIQVNQAGESQKAGIDPTGVETLARLIHAQPRLKLAGLMTLPPAADPPDGNAVYFHRLRELLERLRARGIEMDSLSMGMSADFETAIACGSTCVRIGTAIFGSRRDNPG